MRLPRKKFIVAFAVVALLTTAPAKADPVADFFKRLGDSISKAGKRNAAQRTASKTSSRKTHSKEAKTSEGQTGASPSPSASATELTSDIPPPPSPTIRPASSAPPAPRGKRRDVPYAVPAPDRPGFVTSPYAPTHGLVDVRGFESGTEVKDPYTGKIFLIP